MSLPLPSVRQSQAPEDLLGPLNPVEQKNAPKRLYTSGWLGLMERGPRVSVVGSRKASSLGLRRAASLSRRLVERGIVVVSGLAEGIDSVAHETAIARGGWTVAVLGTPLGQVYPAKNHELQRRIMEKHLAISQFRDGGAIRKSSFPRRNRTMALISDATVIVEATDKSGSLHQGWEALRLGRLLLILKAVADDRQLSWPTEMRRYGAQVLVETDLDDLQAMLPARVSDPVYGLAI